MSSGRYDSPSIRRDEFVLRRRIKKLEDEIVRVFGEQVYLTMGCTFCDKAMPGAHDKGCIVATIAHLPLPGKGTGTD